MKLKTLAYFCTLFLVACATPSPITQDTPVETQTPFLQADDPTRTPIPEATETISSISTPEPTLTLESSDAEPTATAVVTNITLPSSETGTASLDPEVIPLGLTGKLLFTQGTNGLWQADLEAGTLSQLLALPEGGHLGGVTVSPDGLQQVIAYGPPPESGIQLFLTDLYLADFGESELHPLLVRTVEIETFANPVWSPDGEWIYYSHLKQIEDGSVLLNIERYAVDGGGEPEIVIENAHQPTLSSDMTQMAFLQFDQEARTNTLWLANSDGTEGKELLSGTAFPAIVAPRFWHDDTSIVFGASGNLESEARLPSFWDKLLGVELAYAHGAPWALWSISTDGGNPTALTETIYDGTWPSLSPDGQQLAFLEAAAIYLVTENGLVRLAESTREGELIWIR